MTLKNSRYLPALLMPFHENTRLFLLPSDDKTPVLSLLMMLKIASKSTIVRFMATAVTGSVGPVDLQNTLSRTVPRIRASPRTRRLKKDQLDYSHNVGTVS
jgi:hypothetical protein